MNDDSHTYRLFVSPDRTILVRIWEKTKPGTRDIVEVAQRPGIASVWGPPVILNEEET